MTAIIYRFFLGLKSLNIHVNQLGMILYYSNFDNKKYPYFFQKVINISKEI